MRLLITGSRTWTDVEEIREYLIWYNSLVNEEVTLVHGACPHGVDAIANQLAVEFGWKIEQHPADWNKYGKRAGFIRNAEMVKLGADVFLAFIKDGSKGASMCADLAERAGIVGSRICR